MASSPRSPRTLLQLAGVLTDTPPAAPAFADGGTWRIEVPTVNSADAAEELLDGAAVAGVRINRVTETLGMMRHTDAEIRRYVTACAESGAQLLMSVGPRATYDIGAGARTPEGARNGYRLRGQGQLEQALADIDRGVELGVRGLVVYDEGLLAVLAELRAAGHLPPDLHVKVSAHCGHGNPASLQLLARLGADSINPVRDLPVGDLAALRRAVMVPLDVHIDNPPSSGGFMRLLDAPDIVAAAAPVHLKTGNSVMAGHGTRPSSEQVAGMVRQVQLVVETMARHCPQQRQSAPAAAPSRPAAVVGVA